jgi:predicted membrane metal-binding protein
MLVREYWIYYPSLVLSVGGALLFLSIAALLGYLYGRAPPPERATFVERGLVRWAIFFGSLGVVGLIVFVFMLASGGDRMSVR